MQMHSWKTLLKTMLGLLILQPWLGPRQTLSNRLGGPMGRGFSTSIQTLRLRFVLGTPLVLSYQAIRINRLSSGEHFNWGQISGQAANCVSVISLTTV